MSQILEKILLIGFGLTLLLLVTSLLEPFYFALNLNVPEDKFEDENIIDFKKYITNTEHFFLNNLSDSNIFFFNYSGDVSAIINSENETHSQILFRFYNEITHQVKYRSFSINKEWNVQIIEIKINSCLAIKQNSSIFLIFQ